MIILISALWSILLILPISGATVLDEILLFITACSSCLAAFVALSLARGNSVREIECYVSQIALIVILLIFLTIYVPLFSSPHLWRHQSGWPAKIAVLLVFGNFIRTWLRLRMRRKMSIGES